MKTNLRKAMDIHLTVTSRMMKIRMSSRSDRQSSQKFVCSIPLRSQARKVLLVRSAMSV